MKRIIFAITIALLIYPAVVYSRSSENYRINADVIGMGGDLSSSYHYKLTDTIGEPIVGVGSSESYKSKSGFIQEISNSLSLTADADLVEFGTLNPGSPVIQETTITIITDAWAGYRIHARATNPMTHSDKSTTVPDYSCDISSPCIWTGLGLGFTVKSGTSVEAKWGTDPNFEYASFPLSPTTIHVKPDYKSGEDTTVIQYKVDVSSSQQSGSYSNGVIFTALAIL